MAGPEIVIIAALAEKNRVIGRAGELPWYISEDLRRFKKLTVGHSVLMGRKTFDSILQRLGEPLPERRSLVLTKSKDYPQYPEVEIFASLEAALQAAAGQAHLFVIGGEAVFEAMLPLADRLHLTIVEGDYEGDAFFPEYRQLLAERFELAASQPGNGYRFETYVKRQETETAATEHDH